MADEKGLKKLEKQLLKEIGHYGGNPSRKLTEKQMKESKDSLLAWDRAGQPFDAENDIPTDIGPFL